MKKLVILLSAWIFLAIMVISCAKTENKAVQKDIPQETVAIQQFGPFFLPENHSLSSVSLNYVTETPQKTTVYFTMVGEPDWARNDPALTRYHRMVFKDLEESAVYQFTVPGKEKEISRTGAIQTVPFGEDYEFQFAIASMDSDIDNKIQPHFLVLGSEREQVSEKEFLSFYNRNRKLLASTILVPMFGLKLQESETNHYDLTAGNEGFHFIRYKNLSLVLITREMPSYDFLTRYLSNSPDDRNVIVISHTGKNKVIELSQRFALLNCQIYVFTRDLKPETQYDNVTQIDNFQLVNIIKRHSYAMVLTNLAR